MNNIQRGHVTMLHLSCDAPDEVFGRHTHSRSEPVRKLPVSALVKTWTNLCQQQKTTR